MKKLLVVFLLVAVLFFLNSVPKISHQQPVKLNSDPQYLIINESDLLKDKVNWVAPQKQWEEEIKPAVKKRVEKIRNALGKGGSNRKLGFSIIVAYMDYPLDTPTDNSPYVVMVQRLMEISEELNFPVFIPLNGFQWWDQLPELWNWWDADVTQVGGCEEDHYRQLEGREKDGKPIYKCKFPDLRNPAFRDRFARGYNPDNKWNVEWINWNTVMRVTWRNWGGGPFEIAPLPNLVDHKRNKLTYRSVQNERLKVISENIYSILKKWESKNKLDLFAGVAIGTEVSLHAAVDPNNFDLYGYRGIQDIYCDIDHPSCGEHANWSAKKLRQGREEVIYRYLSELSKIAYENGLPKQRIYTHVWGENLPPDKEFVNYFDPAINPYSRPGMSVYTYFSRPLENPILKGGLKKSGYQAWGAPEYFLRPSESDGALNKSFDDATSPAKLVDIYNWNSIENTHAIPVLREFIQQSTTQPACQISEIFPANEPVLDNPKRLSWRYLNRNDQAKTQYLILSRNKIPRFESTGLTAIKIATDSTSFNLAEITLEPGQYYWFIKRSGCGNTKWTTSAPNFFYKGNSLERSIIKLQRFFLKSAN